MGGFWPPHFCYMKIKDLLTLRLSHGKYKVGKTLLCSQFCVTLAALLIMSGDLLLVKMTKEMQAEQQQW